MKLTALIVRSHSIWHFGVEFQSWLWSLMKNINAVKWRFKWRVLRSEKPKVKIEIKMNENRYRSVGLWCWRYKRMLEGEVGGREDPSFRDHLPWHSSKQSLELLATVWSHRPQDYGSPALPLLVRGNGGKNGKENAHQLSRTLLAISFGWLQIPFSSFPVRGPSREFNRYMKSKSLAIFFFSSWSWINSWRWTTFHTVLPRNFLVAN